MGFTGVFNVIVVNDTTLAEIASGAQTTVGSADVEQSYQPPAKYGDLTLSQIVKNALPGVAPFTFDAGTQVDTSGSAIDFPTNPGLQTGETFIYNDDGGTPIGQLKSGHTYFVIVNPATPDVVQLAPNANAAFLGDFIGFTSTGSGEQSLTFTGDGQNLNLIPASVVVEAHDSNLLFNVSGGVMAAQNIGVGASVALDVVKRDTEAFIGDPSNVTSTVQNSTLTSGGAIIVDAENDGEIGTLSLAGTSVSGDTDDPDTTQAQSGPTQGGQDSGEYGIGISADVSFNQINDTTLAYIHDAQVTAQGDVAIQASNTTMVYAVSGAATLVQSQADNDVGLAGSYAAKHTRRRHDGFPR